MEEKTPGLICALCDPPGNGQGALVKDPTPQLVENLKAKVKERIDLGDTKLLPYHDFMKNEDPSRIR